MDAQGFERLRSKLEGIAYRMTGSTADAQDVAQDAWLRWSAADRGEVEDPEAYLVRITTRLSLDRLKSASRRRETYVGPYLPEPLVESVGTGQAVGAEGSARAAEGSPEDRALLADSLTYSFLILLDELSPVERAVLLLHDVFGYPFDQVAEAVDRSPDAVRQLASRTRRRIAAARPGWDPTGDETAPAGAPTRSGMPAETLLKLVVAVGEGDVETLMEVLAPDVVTLSDGGPVQRAARRPVVGADRVSRLLINLNHRALDLDLVTQMVQVNGREGMVLNNPDGTPFVVMTGEVDEAGRVTHLYLQLNPEKLKGLPPAR